MFYNLIVFEQLLKNFDCVTMNYLIGKRHKHYE
jgi:hypothetical protein